MFYDQFIVSLMCYG